MSKSETLMEKIEKLLTLAHDSGATEDEAKTAMLMAQKLMAKNDLSEEELKKRHLRKRAIVSVKLDTGRNPLFRVPLGQIIAKNFKCRMFFGGKEMFFLGYENDVEIAVQIFNYAFKVIIQLGNKAEREAKKNGTFLTGLFNSYAMGFCAGLKVAFEKQCKALMVIVPTEVDDRIKEMCGGRTKKTSSGNMAHSGAFAKGHKDGESFMDERKAIKS